MGGQVSAVREEIKKLDKAAEETATQNLEILQKMVTSQLDKYESHLDASFLNPEGTAKIEVPGIRALRKQRFWTAKVSDKPSEEISGAIDSFFSIGDKTKDGQPVKTEDALKKGFKSVVKGALNIFLGNTETGQSEETKYFIYLHNNAIVRLDVKLFKWNFTGEGVAHVSKSVLGYYICLSIVDVKVLKTPEFVFLVSEYANASGLESEEEIEKYIERMSKLYARARKFAKDSGGDDR